MALTVDNERRLVRGRQKDYCGAYSLLSSYISTCLLETRSPYETALAAILSLIIVYAPPFLSYRPYGPLEFDDQHITPNGLPYLRKYTGYVVRRSAMVSNAARSGYEQPLDQWS